MINFDGEQAREEWNEAISWIKNYLQQEMEVR